MQTTFPTLLLRNAAQWPSAPAMREKEYGIWQTMTWLQMKDYVESLACGLHQAGLTHGEHLVLIGPNRPWLYAAMLAAQTLGAIPVPLYQDAVASELIFPINNADIRFMIVEDQEQVDKVLEIREHCPQLAQIFYADPRGLRHYEANGLSDLQALLDQGKKFSREHIEFFPTQAKKIDPDDVAAMFFTSGTTGNAKGVVHTHRTMVNRAQVGTTFDKLTDREEVLAYLPPAWIGQNIFSYGQWLVAGYVVNCPEAGSTVAIDLKEVGPTYYFAPPRIFEALLTNVMIRMEDAGPFKRRLFHHFLALARRVGPALIDGKRVGTLDKLWYAAGNALVYGALRNNLGFSRARVVYTAGEAIGPDLFSFYRSIGINLKQLYGSTETGVFVCLQPDNEVRIDTVGVPCAGVELKVANNGEILVKSPGLLKEYYKNPAATAEVMTDDGWYRTSDAGFIDGQGHLKIIDRVKDVGRLLGGSNDGAMFAPKYVENKLKFFPFIKEAVALGNQRERVCVLVNIDYEAVGNWAERNNLPYAGYSDLASKPAVYELIRDCMERVNADLSADALLAGSQIHRFLVLHKELDADDGELTRTNKVRRGFIAEKYAALIDAMYAGKHEQFIETQVRFEDGRTGSVSATLHIADSKTFANVKKAA